MTNQEKLTLAAKSCGIAYTCYSEHSDGGAVGLHRPEFGLWNPLADTEAGRSQCAVMCAELGISSIQNHEYKFVCCELSSDGGYYMEESFADHPSKTAAWQSAAVDVAVEIGRAM